MAPRRKQQRQQRQQHAPTKRRSKLALENDITAEQEDEIQAAFALFATPSPDDADATSSIATGDVRRCLLAMNLGAASASELNELVSFAEAGSERGRVPYGRFVAIAALQISRREARQASEPPAQDAEIDAAFSLFTSGSGSAISLADLRRVARELREEVPEQVLQDMLREASGGELSPVGREDFESVMRRAGVWG